MYYVTLLIDIKLLIYKYVPFTITSARFSSIPAELFALQTYVPASLTDIFWNCSWSSCDTFALRGSVDSPLWKNINGERCMITYLSLIFAIIFYVISWDVRLIEIFKICTFVHSSFTGRSPTVTLHVIRGLSPECTVWLCGLNSRRGGTINNYVIK